MCYIRDFNIADFQCFVPDTRKLSKGYPCLLSRNHVGVGVIAGGVSVRVHVRAYWCGSCG